MRTYSQSSVGQVLTAAQAVIRASNFQLAGTARPARSRYELSFVRQDAKTRTPYRVVIADKEATTRTNARVTVQLLAADGDEAPADVVQAFFSSLDKQLGQQRGALVQ
ncbi:hypothetical protein [Salisaeta longa]|uniref:hypothetical protein n=1 Tax=Salisaeta longa TaxID=503170 RepID=UPI0003B5C378|nr:hypothetical protein [Salisaeta longa]